MLPRSWLPAMIVACPRPRRLPESRNDARLETGPRTRPPTDRERSRMRAQADAPRIMADAGATSLAQLFSHAAATAQFLPMAGPRHAASGRHRDMQRHRGG